MGKCSYYKKKTLIYFILLIFFFFRNRSAVNLPKKVDTKQETIMKKSESAHILGCNKVKEDIILTNARYDKSNMSKS